MARPVHHFGRRRRAVYTCMFGFSEMLNEFPIETDETTDFICFTDDPDLKSPIWRMELVADSLLDPVRASKRVKILAHRYLSAYDSSLYVDNTVRLKKSPREIFETYLEHSTSPLVCFRHPERCCVYAEAETILEAKYDDPKRVSAQMAQYQLLNYPAMNGLFKGTFLLRRHNEPLVTSVMETWFEQVLRHSFRDQVSMPVAFNFHKFTPSVIEQDFLQNDILEWPVLKGERLRTVSGAVPKNQKIG